MRRGSRFVMSHVSHIAFGSRAWVSGDTAVPLVTVDIGGLVVELLLCISYSLLNSAIGVTRTHTHTLALHQSASPLAVLLRLLPTLSKNQKIKKSQSELLVSPRPILSAFPYIPPVENLPSIIAKKSPPFLPTHNPR